MHSFYETMCGICGMWLSLRGDRRVEPKVIENMTRSIAHRGPDAGTLHVTPHLGLGHRRLSIIDLENGVLLASAWYDGVFHLLDGGFVVERIETAEGLIQAVVSSLSLVSSGEVR